MDRFTDTLAQEDHQNGSYASNHGHGFYRLQSNASNPSIFEDVEMAHDELYSGPMAESLPTSVSAFSHRRGRADSTRSFSFYQDDEEDEGENEIEDRDEDIRSVSEFGGSVALGRGRIPVHDDEEGISFDDDVLDEEDSADLERQAADNDYVLHRRSSTQSRDSVRSRLLRHDSGLSGSSHGIGRNSQKVYMANEDMYIAIAGFRTSLVGLAAYSFICFTTLGLGWLLFRWLPRWHVRLIGKPTSLRDCQWVVVENQWNEMAILEVESRPYGRPLTSVFGSPGKLDSYLMDEDNDPILRDLRMLNYRYVRFYFHPLKDKFLLCNGWKDPLWSNVREIRVGLDSDEKSHRDVVFGSNLVDIEQKSTFRLLVDEVFHPFYVFQIASLILWSMDSYFYYAAAIFVMSVGSIITTLVENTIIYETAP